MAETPRKPSPDLSAKGWQQRYDNQQTGWDRGGPSPTLLRWLETEQLTNHLPVDHLAADGNPSSTRVLIPGCGRGHEVVELARRGFDVTAIDFAESAVKHLVARLAEQDLVASVVCESVLDYAVERPVDVIYEQTCLCALDPRHWAAYEQQLHANLKINGRLLALFMQTDAAGGPPFHCGLEAMRNLFPEQRWLWASESFTVDHPRGMTEIAQVLTKVDQ